MSDNPYQSPIPDAEAIGVLSGRQDDLESVAKYQKGIIVCILVNLVAIISQFMLPAESRPILGLGAIAVSLVGTVFVFLLATKIYSVPIGILLGILSLIPCIGLIVLLVVNGKATGILKQNGIKVGLLGAKLPKS